MSDFSCCTSNTASIHKFIQPVNSSEYLALLKNKNRDNANKIKDPNNHIGDLLIIANFGFIVKKYKIKNCFCLL